jgi:hypothetical protein
VRLSRLENVIVSELQQWPEDQLPKAKAKLLALAKDI